MTKRCVCFAAMSPTLPTELQRTILDMSRDPQLNISIYDEYRFTLVERMYRTSGGVIEWINRSNHPIRIRTPRGLRALMCGIEHNLAIDCFIIVVHVGSTAPPKTLEDGACIAYRVENTFGKTLVRNESIVASTLYEDEEDHGEAVHKTIERIADWAWDLLSG